MPPLRRSCDMIILRHMVPNVVAPFLIMQTVFGIDLFGDSLRDVLDPKLRSR
jgi:ABC-type dipeptide/oligopeptide/nickel transport system permease subunit